MDKFSTLLVPVDYSPCCEEVLKYAVKLALRLRGEILVLHVVQPVVPITPAYIGPMIGYESVYREMLDKARAYLEELKPLLAAVPHRTLIRTGNPGAEIVAAAEQEKADLIVMATHGRTALSHLLTGSSTEDVLRHASVPVLAVRAALVAPREPVHSRA